MHHPLHNTRVVDNINVGQDGLLAMYRGELAYIMIRDGNPEGDGQLTMYTLPDESTIRDICINHRFKFKETLDMIRAFDTDINGVVIDTDKYVYKLREGESDWSLY